MEVPLPENRTEVVTLSGIDECAHHWMIETPNGESSTGHCKACGATKAFLNYSQRKILTRSVKPANGMTAPPATAPVAQTV